MFCSIVGARSREDIWKSRLGSAEDTKEGAIMLYYSDVPCKPTVSDVSICYFQIYDDVHDYGLC